MEYNCRLYFGILLTLLNLSVVYSQTDTINIPSDKSPSLYIQKITDRNYNKGYCGFSVDELDSLKSQLVLFEGARYRWGIFEIYSGNDVEGISPRGYFSAKKFQTILKNTTSEYLNNGYPFVKLDYTHDIRGNSIYIQSDVLTGDYFYFDSIFIDSAFLKERNFIQNLTRINPGSAYCNKNVVALPERINNSGVYTLVSREVVFGSDQKALVKLDLDRMKANSFSAFLGIQSNEGEKAVLTGSADLSLVNVFKSGERINFKWEKYNAESQNIDLDSEYPYFLNTSVGLEANLSIRKQDSVFTNSTISAGISSEVFHSGRVVLRSSYGQSVYNYFDTVDVSENTKSRTVGLEYRVSKLNNLYNPSKGFKWSASSDVGERDVQTQQGENSYMLTGYDVNFKVFIPVKRFVFVLGNELSLIFSDSLNRSELKTIGGSELLRGFDENSIFTDKSTVFSFETRYLFGKRSNVYAFFDYAYSNEPLGFQVLNSRMGTGVGLMLSTKAGVLSLAYALGKRNSDSIKLSEAKIHVGYINYF